MTSGRVQNNLHDEVARSRKRRFVQFAHLVSITKNDFAPEVAQPEVVELSNSDICRHGYRGCLTLHSEYLLNKLSTFQPLRSE